MSIDKIKQLLKNEKINRIMKFGIVGGSGVVVDFGVETLLSYFLKNILNEQIAKFVCTCIGYELAVISNFLLSYFWVWKDRKGNITVNFIKYQISTLIALGIRLILLFVVTEVFHISMKDRFLLYQGCYLAILMLVMIINFLLIEFHVFKKPEQANPAE